MINPHTQAPDQRSTWTHSICRHCWNVTHPDRPTLFPGIQGEPDTCCRCGIWTTSGIYVRANPDDFTFCVHSA
jgi:hypothetical protein